MLGGIVITAILILASVWTSTNRLVNEQLQKELEVSQGVFARVMTDRSELISKTSSMLGRDVGFATGFADGDIPTINSMLDNHSGIIGADFIAILKMDGEIKTIWPRLLPAQSQFPAEKLVEDLYQAGSSSGFVLLNDKLYQTVLVTVNLPTPVAIYAVGYAFDAEFLAELKEILQADIIVETKDPEQGSRVVVSTLSDRISTSLINDKANITSWFDITLLHKQAYVARTLMLPGDEDSPVLFNVAIDVTQQYRSFSELQIKILGIALLAILISLGISMLLARRVSEPVGKLVKAVDLISQGNYEQELATSGRVKEIVELANAFASMQSSIQSREKRISYQAEHDVLTGLYNRYYMEALVDKMIAEGQEIQIIGVNIIGFRTINDLYGYAHGDTCLKVLAQRLSRWPGTAARLSGGEIIYIAESRLNLMQLETFRHILEQSVETGLVSIPLKIVLAEILCPEDAHSSEELFRKVNIVVDEAIHADRWLVRYQPELEQRYLRRLTIITELKKSLQSVQSELSLVYQPKVALDVMKVCSMEALIRWNNATLGFVPPDEFISIAEQAGLIEQVTLWVLQRTITDLVTFREAGFTFTVAMNLSTQDIQNRELLDKLNTMLNQAGLSAKDLELEITESDLVEDAGEAIANLEKLREQGFKLAIDDFGTGYSSLAYLKNLPVDTIKIDKSFVLALSKESSDQQIVHTVLSLAKIFELSVVAEGVEDEHAMAILSEWGCDIAQGYYISKPLSPKDLKEWLHQSKYK